MIPKEQLEDYFKKSGDTKLVEGKRASHPEHGFCIYDYDEEKLILLQVFGNGVFWDRWAEKKAEQLGLNKIMFATQRSPKAYCRKYGYTVVGYVLEREI